MQSQLDFRPAYCRPVAETGRAAGPFPVQLYQPGAPGASGEAGKKSRLCELGGFSWGPFLFSGKKKWSPAQRKKPVRDRAEYADLRRRKTR